jgi:chromosome segregation ATPase
MASLEERVAALEARMEEIAAQSNHATDLAVVAAREALTAREAHQRNIELLNALRKTQAEHGRRLDSIDGRLDSIDGRLDSIDGRLSAVEDGLGTVDGKLGTLAAGMHRIESLLTHLIENEGSAG